jgi:hypothetical protein
MRLKYSKYKKLNEEFCENQFTSSHLCSKIFEKHYVPSIRVQKNVSNHLGFIFYPLLRTLDVLEEQGPRDFNP